MSQFPFSAPVELSTGLLIHEVDEKFLSVNLKDGLDAVKSSLVQSKCFPLSSSPAAKPLTSTRTPAPPRWRRSEKRPPDSSAAWWKTWRTSSRTTWRFSAATQTLPLVLVSLCFSPTAASLTWIRSREQNRKLAACLSVLMDFCRRDGRPTHVSVSSPAVPEEDADTQVAHQRRRLQAAAQAHGATVAGLFRHESWCRQGEEGLEDVGGVERRGRDFSRLVSFSGQSCD